MDCIYPDKSLQNPINVSAAFILNENLISSDIETTFLANEQRLRQVQSWREIGVFFSTERDPNWLEQWVRKSYFSLTGGKSDVFLKRCKERIQARNPSNATRVTKDSPSQASFRGISEPIPERCPSHVTFVAKDSDRKRYLCFISGPTQERSFTIVNCVIWLSRTKVITISTT
ncbi:hypothetical protein AVEN_67676-1 [Araneus ventricosus]|uniref:Uncharacterized protein n=1 Tax=Araneus ventricosus TaxID=182803 RepID=A0A4Y2WP39_ARAVE|nr:hypothetical protein AVEN_67676-1 [Araneus ventricosus]